MRKQSLSGLPAGVVLCGRLRVTGRRHPWPVVLWQSVLASKLRGIVRRQSFDGRTRLAFPIVAIIGEAGQNSVGCLARDSSDWQASRLQGPGVGPSQLCRLAGYLARQVAGCHPKTHPRPVCLFGTRWAYGGFGCNLNLMCDCRSTYQILGNPRAPPRRSCCQPTRLHTAAAQFLPYYALRTRVGWPTRGGGKQAGCACRRAAAGAVLAFAKHEESDRDVARPLAHNAVRGHAFTTDYGIGLDALNGGYAVHAGSRQANHARDVPAFECRADSMVPRDRLKESPRLSRYLTQVGRCIVDGARSPARLVRFQWPRYQDQPIRSLRRLASERPVRWP